MTDITSQTTKITVDATTQLTADQWEIDTLSSEQFLAASRVESYDLKTGLLVDGNPDLVKHITAGKPDEWELSLTPSSLVGRVRGRDAAAFILDTSVMTTLIIGGIDWRQFHPPAPEALPPGLRPIPNVTQRTYHVGAWTAKKAAEFLCELVGLTCSWLVPDYRLVEDLEVNGPILPAIQKLAEPWKLFEPFKADIWVEGTTMVVRQRPGLIEFPSPSGPTPGPLNTINITDMRISDFMIRKKPLDYIRILRLNGGPIGPCVHLLDSERTQFETTNAAGDTVTRVTELRFTRHEDKAYIGGQKDTEAAGSDGLLRLASRETIVNVWEDFVFDGVCRILNNPKQLASQTLTKKADKDGTIRDSSRTTVQFTYDTNEFMSTQSTLIEVVNKKTGTYKQSSLEIKRFIDNGVKLYQESTEFYTSGKKGWQHVSTTQGPGGGYRPGGLGRAPKETLDNRAFVAIVIDDLPGAKDISYENPALTQLQLNILKEQAEHASGAWEYEVNFNTVGCPWLRKGQMLFLTGFFAEDGVTPITLQPALVFEVHTELDEPGLAYTTRVKAVWWQKT